MGHDNAACRSLYGTFQKMEQHGSRSPRRHNEHALNMKRNVAIVSERQKMTVVVLAVLCRKGNSGKNSEGLE